jgi:hypothetical protein
MASSLMAFQTAEVEPFAHDRDDLAIARVAHALYRVAVDNGLGVSGHGRSSESDDSCGG